MTEQQLPAIDEARLSVPEDATSSEAAAMAVALGTHIQDQRAAAASDSSTDETWDGKRFAFAGRLDGLGRFAHRVPRGAPTDEWTASGRTERY